MNIFYWLVHCTSFLLIFVQQLFTLEIKELSEALKESRNENNSQPVPLKIFHYVSERLSCAMKERKRVVNL